MNKSVQLTSKTKERFDAYVEDYGCKRYQPCPICYKCMVKASHLFQKCGDCDIPFCVHDDKKRNMIIKRSNFAITVSKETEQAFRALGGKDGQDS